MDAISHIAFVGGESSGKTTISRMFSETVGIPWVPEFGRTFYETKPIENAEYVDMIDICIGHLEDELVAEGKAKQLGKVAISVDTTALTTYFYSMEWFGKAEESVKRAATYKFHRTMFFLCKNDFPFEQDGTRQNIEFANKQYEFYKMVLDTYKVPYLELEGSRAKRLQTVTTFYEAFVEKLTK